MSMEKAADTLRLYLGPYGCKCGLLDFDGLMETAKLTFDVPGATIFEVAQNVEALGRKVRANRARVGIKTHWPTPNALWPANAPGRKERRGRHAN